MRLWIDTDVGDDPDDAIALLCADAHPAIDLVGVSTVDGDHDRRVRAARALVDAPVYRGDDPELGAAIGAGDVDALLAIGPLTNVAAFAAAGVALPPVTLMGGMLDAVRHWGVTIDVEHNFARDPSGAATALRACAPALVVPLDVTVSTALDQGQLGDLLAGAPAVEPCVQAWLDRQGAVGVPAEERAIFLHDPLAFLTMVEPTVVDVEERALHVESDGRLVDAPGGVRTRIARSVDAPRAIHSVLRLVARGVG